MKTAIFDIDNWREIVATLARNKTRTFLTAFGIFWGTAMLAMLIGGASGLESMMRSNFDNFATNTGVIFAGRTTMTYRGFQKGRTWKLTTEDIDQIRTACPEIDALTTINSVATNASSGHRSISTDLQGVDSDFPKIFLPVIYEGRFINLTDDLQSRKVCVLGKSVANNLFPGESPVGRYVSIGGIYYQVVGVCGQINGVQINGTLDEQIQVPGSTLRKSYAMGTDVGEAMFTVKDGTTPTDITPRIRRVLSANHFIDPADEQAIMVWDISENFKMIENLFVGISILALFVGMGSLLAGVIGVGNIMWVIVKERTQEIGIRRAIGAKPSDVITQILSESVMLTLVAGVAGICFAVLVLGVAEVVTAKPPVSYQFQLSFTEAVTILVAFIVLGTLAGIVPALKAMRIKPIEAINDH